MMFVSAILWIFCSIGNVYLIKRILYLYRTSGGGALARLLCEIASMVAPPFVLSLSLD